ncbi:unnamed protein product [Rotaria sp. Silwood2]|nr:unnamed protein product [Rotaria sp. Silwood2]
MTSSFLVLASTQTEKQRRIELSGTDLWIMDRIDNVFVYPANLNVNRFIEALGRTLCLWPFIAGRFLLLEGDRYVIEMSDNPIPVSVVENNDLLKWPFDSKVLVDLRYHTLEPFIDEVPIHKLLCGSSEEPLVRFKFTRLVKSDEFVMGISWAHVLGDAASCLRFLTTISRLYQQLQPLEPFPIFERRLWTDNTVNRSLLNIMKPLRDSEPAEQMFQTLIDEQMTHDQLNLHFSSKQLIKLRTLAGSGLVTIQDALTSYIIRTLNCHCFQNDDHRRILRTDTAVNFRGVTDSIAPQGLIANAVFMMLSDDFDDPYSLSNIAQTIRRSIIKSRDAKFLEPWLATANVLMRTMAREQRLANIRHSANEIVVNSNLKYNWASLVDFGYTDKCRFHTVWAGVLYLRVFHLNPVYDGTKWIPPDRNGAEVAFRLDSETKEKCTQALENYVQNNFDNIDK